MSELDVPVVPVPPVLDPLIPVVPEPPAELDPVPLPALLPAAAPPAAPPPAPPAPPPPPPPAANATEELRAKAKANAIVVGFMVVSLLQSIADNRRSCRAFPCLIFPWRNGEEIFVSGREVVVIESPAQLPTMLARWTSARPIRLTAPQAAFNSPARSDGCTGPWRC
jgi:hypothetical protein